MTTLTINEQTSLNILNAVNAKEIQEIQLTLTRRFIDKGINILLMSIYREAMTEKLAEFGYKSCGGAGR
jgi:hypothetical protein